MKFISAMAVCAACFAVTSVTASAQLRTTLPSTTTTRSVPTPHVSTPRAPSPPPAPRPSPPPPRPAPTVSRPTPPNPSRERGNPIPGPTLSSRPSPESNSGRPAPTRAGLPYRTVDTAHPDAPGLVRRSPDERPDRGPEAAPGRAVIRGPENKPMFAVPGKEGRPSEGTVHLPRGSAVPTSSPGRYLLTDKGSRAALTNLNHAREGMGGINRAPLPHGEMILRSNGSMSLRAADGRDFRLRPNGTVASLRFHGEDARFGADGHIRAFHDPQFNMRRGPHGEWHTFARGPDHARLVSDGFHRGFLEHPVVYGNRGFLRATYVDGNRVSVRVYADYPYRGAMLHRYLPPVYYSPAFYGWAARPWAGPVGYRWGFVGSPGYVETEGYFAVSPAYVGPPYWLTDFLLSATIVAQQFAGPPGDDGDPTANVDDADDWAQMSGDDQDGAIADDANAGDPSTADADDPSQDAPPPVIASDADAPITPAIKDQLATEIREQVALDSAGQPVGNNDPGAGLDGLPTRLAQPGYLFVVSQEQRADTPEGAICRLRPGDTVRLQAAVSNADPAVHLLIASSRAHDCPAGAQVLLPIPAMQAMWNDMRAQMENGLAQLRYDRTGGGLPAPPLSAVAAPLVQGVPSDLSAPDQNAAALLDQQQNLAAAKATEAETLAQGQP